MLEYILSILQELSSIAADAQTTQIKQLPLRSNKAWKGSDPKTKQPQMVFATKQIPSDRRVVEKNKDNQDSRAIVSTSHFLACVTSYEDKLVIVARQAGQLHFHGPVWTTHGFFHPHLQKWMGNLTLCL